MTYNNQASKYKDCLNESIDLIRDVIDKKKI